jgi:hypothetical protein
MVSFFYALLYIRISGFSPDPFDPIKFFNQTSQHRFPEFSGNQLSGSSLPKLPFVLNCQRPGQFIPALGGTSGDLSSELLSILLVRLAAALNWPFSRAAHFLFCNAFRGESQAQTLPSCRSRLGCL